MANTIGIIQSNYLPWVGYFDFIQSCDLFIFHDDIQYTKDDWRNRNRIKAPSGVRWISVPVIYKDKLKTTIDRTPINYDLDWQKDHKHWMKVAYQKAPFYSRYQERLFSIIDEKYESISDLNQALLRWLLEELGISRPIKNSRDLKVEGSKTDRVIALLKATGAKTYLSGPAAKDYLEVDKFREAGIGLRYKRYQYPEYPQLHGPFVAGLSIVDALFNCGPEIKSILKSQLSDEVVVE